MIAEWAEDCRTYWKTSQSTPDTWLDRTEDMIKKAGGGVLASGFGAQGDRAAYMIEFIMDEERIRIAWPVLPSKKGDVKAAKVQAVTMMYHDIKARLVSAQVLGTRVAFFNWVMLPDGRTASSVALSELIPAMIAAPV